MRIEVDNGSKIYRRSEPSRKAELFEDAQGGSISQEDEKYEFRFGQTDLRGRIPPTALPTTQPSYLFPQGSSAYLWTHKARDPPFNQDREHLESSYEIL
ncbi:hypothetical protein KM043_001713 [Ampulex compressa]|nr:hypothetical protein KM043_001713 [Ampulex compressa]